MADNPENLMLRQLQAIRDDQALTNRKLGVLADSIVSLRSQMNTFSTRMDDLTGDVRALRTDVQAVAIAVDAHAERLTRIEDKLALPPQ